MDATQMVIIGRFTIAAGCFAGAAYVAASGNEGWGWLIVAGIFMGGITISD